MRHKLTRRCLHARFFELPWSLGRRIERYFLRPFARRRDLNYSTLSVSGPSAVRRGWFDTFMAAPLIDSELLPALRATAQLHAGNRFDILGAGWELVAHGFVARGCEGKVFPAEPVVSTDRDGIWLRGRINTANLAAARAAWQHVDANYTPIDWQLDVRSGFRWSEAVWFRDLPLSPAGADIKVPWELARFHHGPQLALAYSLVTRDMECPSVNAENWYRAFRNQVLDFIGSNPPRFGVNWVSPMDIAIRAANWVVAYELFTAAGVEFDPAFDKIFYASVQAHGSFVRRHLERAPHIRGNHYLANLAGLLVIAAWLPASGKGTCWVNSTARAFLVEADRQFDANGANFESSTSYHRLSAEMVAWGTATLLRLMAERRLPEAAVEALPAHLARLPDMATFSRDITGPAGRVVQIGDNDSGRFLRIAPPWRRGPVAAMIADYANLNGYNGLPPNGDYWFEDMLDHAPLRDLLAACSGGEVRYESLEGEIEAALLGSFGRDIPSLSAAPVMRRADMFGVSQDLVSRARALPTQWRRECWYPVMGWDARDGLDLAAYPQFGAYVFRSKSVFAVVRCGPLGNHGRGVHAHNDQLSLCLSVNGTEVLSDPGSYLYTPAPDWRNRYRAAAAHNAPRIAGREPGNLNAGLFYLGNEAQAECHVFGPSGFVGSHKGYGRKVWRAVLVESGGVRVIDWVNPAPGEAPPVWRNVEPEPFSPAYGWREVSS